MDQKHSLTFHAQERLIQRSTESPESLINIIIEERYLKIGKELGSNREHLLFFSNSDNIWHTIVLDVKTKEIITILPVDFHENISWKISQDALEMTRKWLSNVVRKNLLKKSNF